MGVRVYWEDAGQTIVHYDFEGKWAWDDLYAAYYQAIAMETSVQHRVDVILDLRRSTGVPANVLLHLKNFSEKQPPNIGLSIFVTSSKFLLSLYEIGIKFHQKIAYYFRLVETLDLAQAMITADRKEKQPDSSPL